MKEEIKQILINHSQSINEYPYDVHGPENSFNDVSNDIISYVQNKLESLMTNLTCSKCNQCFTCMCEDCKK